MIRLRHGTVRSDLAVTENDGSWTWSVPAAQAPGTYSILVRSVDGAVTAYSPDFVVADCAVPAPAIKRAPPFERPLPVAFPPQPRITDFTLDPRTFVARLSARNFGGAMKQDAQVVLKLGQEQIQALTWPKGRETFAWGDRLFSISGEPHLAECKLIGGGQVCLRAEILSLEIQGNPYPGLYDMECVPCWQDLMVAGFQWHSTGKLTFSVGNAGYCPSGSWTYRLYRMGELVETSPRFGSQPPGVWTQVTANYSMPASAGGSCLFRVDVIPDNAGQDNNSANNSCEFRVVPDWRAFDVIISDIRVAGEVENWENNPPATDAYWQLIPILKNTGNASYPEVYAHIQVAIDGRQVMDQRVTIALDPHEEVAICHSRFGIHMPVLPYGNHEVTVAVSNLCPVPMKKRLMRPPLG